jgi:serine protease AprX
VPPTVGLSRVFGTAALITNTGRLRAREANEVFEMTASSRFGSTPRPGRASLARLSLRSLVSLMIVWGLALVVAGVGWGATAYNPAADPYSMANTTAYTGATAWWNAGYTGDGVDVAVIDTGVSPVAGLDGPDKIINGPDLSLESQNPAFAHLDTNGHGTFMASLIAGHDPTLTAPYANAPASAYRGMAPDARIVALKVGVADGGVDVSQVIAAIDWVVQHKNDNGMNIRVLNLSYGTNASQSYMSDPLAYAVEQAWKAGIFVVVAAGNAGFTGGRGGSMVMPALDPFVLAVGASDSNGTGSMSDDKVTAFSSTGNWKRHVDLVAPGSHLVGLRDPGSYVDQAHGSTGYVAPTLFRGSGTSESTALVSGAAALIIQQRPSITPGQLKLLLMNSTVTLGVSNIWQGRGELDLTKALGASSTQTDSWHMPSSGNGSLEQSRGTDHLTLNGVVLTGEQDIFGHSFNSSAMAAAEAAGTSWSGGSWNGNDWSGDGWGDDGSWEGNTWSGNSWSGNTWSGNTWSGNSWSGNSWSGNSWSGNSWSGNSWSGNSWSGDAWS